MSKDLTASTSLMKQLGGCNVAVIAVIVFLAETTNVSINLTITPENVTLHETTEIVSDGRI